MPTVLCVTAVVNLSDVCFECNTIDVVIKVNNVV